MKLRITVLAAAAAATLAAPVWADTTDVRTQSWVRVKKTGAHCAEDPNCMNRYHPAIPMVATARPGQLVLFETRDALDSDLNVNSQGKDLAAVDLNLVHPLTGPVFIEGAKRGDVLAVTLVDIDPDEYGYTTIVPGFGFLRDRYTEPVHRQLAAQPDGGGLRPGAGRGDSDERLHGHGREHCPGPEEVDTWVARETQLGEAGGVALPPQPTGARPAAICGPNGKSQGQMPAYHSAARERRQHGHQADGGRHHAAAAVLRRRLRLVRGRRSLCAGRRRGVPEPPSRWARRSRCAPRSAAACCR